jgi:hypothetical protein
MSEPHGFLSLVTLGISDLKRSIAFYETARLPSQSGGG